MLARKYVGRALYYQGRSGEAVAELRRAIEINPQFPGLHYELGRALLQSTSRRLPLRRLRPSPTPPGGRMAWCLDTLAAIE